MHILPYWLNLDYFSVARLGSLTISVIITVYLFCIREKSKPTRLLAWAFLGATLFNLQMVLEHASSYYWQPHTVKNYLNPYLQCVGACLAVFALILFAYRYPHFYKSDEKEYRVAVGCSITLNIVNLGLTAYYFSYLQIVRSHFELDMAYYLVIFGSVGAQFVYVIFLLIRKTIRLAGDPDLSVWQKLIYPRRTIAKAVRALALVLILPIAVVAAYVLRVFGFFPAIVTIYFAWYLFLLFYISFVVTYLNHTPEKTTFQVKLVGGVLTVFLGIIGIISFFVSKHFELDYVNRDLIGQKQSIVFAPNEHNSYTVTRECMLFDDQLGEAVDIEYDEKLQLDLPFPFPFFHESFETLYLTSGPLVMLGENPKEKGWGGFHPEPAIAPLIMDLDPDKGGGVYVKVESSRIAVTWYDMPERSGNMKNTVQLIMHKNGRMVFTYRELNPDRNNRSIKIDLTSTVNTTGIVLGGWGQRSIPFAPRLIGVHPGGRDTVLRPLKFLQDLPYQSRMPEAIFEAYDISYYNGLHDRISPLVIITIASSLFILFLFPILFQSSIIRPLKALYRGMQRAVNGDLDTAIQPEFNDEIGFISEAFNTMLQSIKRMENNFRALADNSQDGIIILSEKGERLYANERVLAMLGVQRRDFSISRFWELIPPADNSDIQDQLSWTGMADAVPWSLETFLQRADQEDMPVELTISRTVWHGKAADVLFLRDISARKREEEKGREQQQRLLLMDKLISLGILVAGVSHEINNPNQNILLNADLLQRSSWEILSLLKEIKKDRKDFLVGGLKFNEFEREYPGFIESIKRNSERIDGIINNLRAFYRDSPGMGMSQLEINKVITSAVDLTMPYIHKATSHFQLELGDNLPPIKGNQQRLEQVLINLILNACQALAEKEQGISVVSRYQVNDKQVVVEVRDSGVGISEGNLEWIKKPFYTMKRANGGSGLGVYVSETIMQEHKGELRFSSDLGQGTRVEIVLPAEEQI